MPQIGRPGRPWGPIRADRREASVLAQFLRGLVDASGKTLKEVSEAIHVSPSAASLNLSGRIPSENFVISLVEATVSNPALRARHRIRAISLLQEAANPAAKPSGRAQAAIPVQGGVTRAQGEVQTYDRLVRALEYQADLERARGNSQNLIMIMLGMIDQLTRRVDELKKENEELVTVSASLTQIEESAVRLERAEAQRERAEEELRRAEEKRQQAEQLTSLVQQQVAQLTEELEKLRQQASNGSADVDRTAEDVAQELEDQAADIDQAIARATAVNDSDDQVIRRISAEISDDGPVIQGSGYSPLRTEESQPRVISGGLEPTPPHDLSAERAVLGCMILSADASADVVEIVTSLDFYLPEHAEIFEEISSTRANGEPFEVEILAQRLQSSSSHQADWSQLLNSLVVEAPEDFRQVGASAEVVRERAVLRRLIAASSHITQLSYQSKSDIQEIIDQAQAEIQAVALHRGPQDYAPLGDIMEGALDDIEGIGKPQGSFISGLATGFSDLDNLINGLPIGGLTVVAGESGVGKTTFALDLIRACSVRWNSGSLLFSLQTNRNEIATRILSAEARVAIHHMTSGLMTDDDWTRLARVMPQVSSAPLYIDDSSSPPLEEISAKSRRLVRENDIKLIVVDSVQLLDHNWSTAEELRIAAHRIARKLRMLARELNVPIVAISDLEVPAGRYSTLPGVDDLHEWKILDQNADVVILLNRDDLKDKASPRAGEADFLVTKNKSGPTGVVVTAFMGHYCRFVGMTEY